MNFQQLRFVREAVRQNMNLTEVANVLYTSQSGVSKQIKDLEDELGVDIFIRRGKRLTGLTEPGKEVHQLIERMLLDAENLRRVARQFADQDNGHLVVATTHTQARYALPKVIRKFTEVFPKVHLALRQGSPQQIAQMIINGEADIGISTEALDRYPDIVTFPCYSWHHTVVVPKDHPLVGRENITLDRDRGVSDRHLRQRFHRPFARRPGVREGGRDSRYRADGDRRRRDQDVCRAGHGYRHRCGDGV